MKNKLFVLLLTYFCGAAFSVSAAQDTPSVQSVTPSLKKLASLMSVKSWEVKFRSGQNAKLKLVNNNTGEVYYSKQLEPKENGAIDCITDSALVYLIKDSVHIDWQCNSTIANISISTNEKIAELAQLTVSGKITIDSNHYLLASDGNDFDELKQRLLSKEAKDRHAGIELLVQYE